MMIRARLVDTDGLRTYGYVDADENDRIICWGGQYFVRREGESTVTPKMQIVRHFDRVPIVLRIEALSTIQ